MAHINHYEVLQIEQTSDLASIRNAFKKLAMKYHPDRNIGDASAEIMMKKLNEAMEVLSDPRSRKDHDQNLAEDNAKRLAEEYAKKLAEDNAKRLAEENAKKLAEENAKRLNKNAALAAYNDGTASALRKDFQATINHFTRTIELDPTFAEAYISRGNTYGELKAYHESVSDYTLAIKFDPENVSAFNSRGIAYYRLKKYPEAITDYTIAIEINPSEADIYYNRGLSYGALGRHYFALDDYIQAIRLNPLHAKAHIYLKKARQQLNAKAKTKEEKITEEAPVKSPYIKTHIKKTNSNVTNKPLFYIGSGILVLFVIMGLIVSLFKSIESSIEKEMVLIPAGKFKMGSPASEKNRNSNETHHEVTLTKPFYMGKHEVTQGQWEAVMEGSNPSETQGAKLPVTNVSWEDCQGFIKKLNTITKGGYRLPTEAEWEYACRAGTSTAYSFGDSLTKSDANIDGGNLGSLKAVGSYKPNAFGLYDMHGNVWEWCEDRYGDYPAGAVTDPKGLTGWTRVLRGGSFLSYVYRARSSTRTGGSIDREFTDGFRLARAP
jgi:formylglycine-generating enzyme required for sulfatase activity/Flp pilus assembly protein TadD